MLWVRIYDSVIAGGKDDPFAPIRLNVFEKGAGAAKRLGKSWQQGSGYLHIVSRESHSARQGLLDLLERLALCFRKAPANEQKASHANAGIDPEGSRRPNAPVQQWKRIGKNEAGDPQ